MKKLHTLTAIAVALLLSSFVKAVPLLNSNITSDATIYLDFDGHYVNSGMWNGGSAFTCSQANLSNPQITEIFNRVAEDFRPFDLNITTDSTVYIAAPFDKRIRIIVTATHYWYPGVGGVAWIGSFIWSDDTPAFVFSDALGNSTKAIAEACSHEGGHSLGLSHQSKYDGTDCSYPIETYNSGQGTGQSAWAPVMGNSYGRNMTNWNNGPTQYGCNSVQDNLGIITSQNGFDYRIDDFSDNPEPTATATATGNFLISGVISTNTDKDAFKLTITKQSNYHFAVLPVSIGANNEGANLDAKLEIYNNSGILISTHNPFGKMDIAFDTTLNIGTYFFIVDGAGNNNVGEYGSLGGYNFTGINGALPIKEVVLSGYNHYSNHNLSWSIISSEPVKNITIQSSNDGVNFNNNTQIDISKNTVTLSNNQYYYYRLQVVSVTGQIAYSNTINLKELVNTNTFFSVSTFIYTEISVTASRPYQYQLFNSTGVLLRTGTAKAGLNSINMQSAPSGIYIIKLQNDIENITQRILKQ
jgi:hypothetical protein